MQMLYIHLPLQFIRHTRNQFNHRMNQCCPIRRMIQLPRLPGSPDQKRYKVHCRCSSQLPKCFFPLPANKRIRILPVGKRQKHQVHTPLQRRLNPPHHSRLTGLIRIINHQHFLGIALQHPNLILRKRRPTRRHHMLQPGLMHGNHIRIPLHQDHLLLSANLIFRKIQPVEYFTLIIDFRLCRIYILGGSLVISNHPSTKRNELTRRMENRKHQPVAECVVVPISPITRFDKIRFQEIFIINAFTMRFLQKLLSATGCVAQAKCFLCGRIKPTLMKNISCLLRFVRFPKLPMIVQPGKRKCVIDALPLLLLMRRLISLIFR